MSSANAIVQPALLSKINERHILRVIQSGGPMSRAEVARHSGVSPPTASKAVEALLRAGFLEEGDAPETARGRPARILRLANQTAQVLGLVIDAEQCRMVCAGLDGKLHEDCTEQFATPAAYEEFLTTSVRHAQKLMCRPGITTLGLAISMPGLIDYRQNRGLISPNVPMTNQQSPAQDLADLLGIECILVQESHALCLAERSYGNARSLNDFAMVDVSAGVGLGVMSGGRLLTGHSGLAGEIGHITIEPEGRLCGCGNYGCLETVASDRGLAWMISQRLGRAVSIEEAVVRIQQGDGFAVEALEKTCRYLSIGLAMVINLFNPSTLFVHGRLFAADAGLFSRLVEQTGRRALPPSYNDCRIVQAQGSKRQGAVAAIIEHLTSSGLPSLFAPPALFVTRVNG